MAYPFKHILYSVVCVLLQVLWFNNISIVWGTTAFLYITVILGLPSDIGQKPIITIAFFTGLIVDIFGTTPGVHCTSLTMLAFMRSFLLRITNTHNTGNDIVKPSIHSMGFFSFLNYSFISSFIFCAISMALQAFSQFELATYLAKTLICTIVTTASLVVFEFVERK